MPMAAAAGASRAPNPILAVLGRVLERVIDRALDLDPATRDALGALDGRAIRIDLSGTPLAMRLAVDGARIRVGPAFEGESALGIAATPGALVSMALARGREGSIAPGRVEVSGDADLARRIERIASRFEPDFDEAFARAFGDVAGHRIARALRAGLASVSDGSRRFAHDVAEFLTEEDRSLVARVELDAFLDDVDRLRDRADRLDARVRRIAEVSRKSEA